jgi:hypothetical protein
LCQRTLEALDRQLLLFGAGRYARRPLGSARSRPPTTPARRQSVATSDAHKAGVGVVAAVARELSPALTDSRQDA